MQSPTLDIFRTQLHKAPKVGSALSGGLSQINSRDPLLPELFSGSVVLLIASPNFVQKKHQVWLLWYRKNEKVWNRFLVWFTGTHFRSFLQNHPLCQALHLLCLDLNYNFFLAHPTQTHQIGNKYTELHAHIWFWESRLSSPFFSLWTLYLWPEKAARPLFLLRFPFAVGQQGKLCKQRAAVHHRTCPIPISLWSQVSAHVSYGGIYQCWGYMLDSWISLLKASSFWTKYLSPVFGSVISHPHDSEEGDLLFLDMFLFCS